MLEPDLGEGMTEAFVAASGAPLTSARGRVWDAFFASWLGGWTVYTAIQVHERPGEWWNWVALVLYLATMLACWGWQAKRARLDRQMYLDSVKLMAMAGSYAVHVERKRGSDGQ